MDKFNFLSEKISLKLEIPLEIKKWLLTQGSKVCELPGTSPQNFNILHEYSKIFSYQTKNLVISSM